MSAQQQYSLQTLCVNHCKTVLRSQIVSIKRTLQPFTHSDAYHKMYMSACLCVCVCNTCMVFSDLPNGLTKLFKQYSLLPRRVDGGTICSVKSSCNLVLAKSGLCQFQITWLFVCVYIICMLYSHHILHTIIITSSWILCH